MLTENHSYLTYNYVREKARVARSLDSLVSFSMGCRSAVTVVKKKVWYAVAVQLTNIQSRQENYLSILVAKVNDKWSALISNVICYNERANVWSASNVASLVLMSAIPGPAKQF